MYDYKIKKKRNLAKLEKAGDEIVLIVVRFDQNTGEKKEPMKVRLNEKTLKENKTIHEEEIADINAVLADIKKLLK